MDHAPGFDDAEIIDQKAIGFEGLGAHTGASRMNIIHLQLGQQLLEGSDKGVFAEGALKFAQAHPPMLGGQMPKAAISSNLPSVGRRETGLLIPFALEREHGVRASLDATVDHAREM